MVGGGSTRPRPPVLTRGVGDRQPSDPSRRTRPCVPPTRHASDAGSQSPRTSNRRDTCHKVITDHCRFWGRCPFFFKSWNPPKRNRTRGDGHRHQKRPGPDPKRHPHAGNRKRTPKTRPKSLVGPTVKDFRNLKRPRLRSRRSGRPRLQIQCRSRPRELLSEHATSDPTPPTARHGESWNVMPAVWSWQAGGDRW